MIQLDAGQRRPSAVTTRLLSAARLLPRGRWRVVHWLAQKDPALQRLNLRNPGVPISFLGDLRIKSCIPHFLGNASGGRRLIEFLPRIVQQGDIVFDVGTNIGLMSTLIAHCAGPQGRVVSIEPNPRLIDLINDGIGKEPTVTVVQAAVSDEIGEAVFYATEDTELGSFAQQDGAASFTVKVTTLDALADEHGTPNLVKVDVEGFEDQVFRGGGRLLRGSSCPLVVFEALDDAVLTRSSDLLGQLSGAEFEVFGLGRGGRLIDATKRESSDFLFVPANQRDRIAPLLQDN